jgi:hypothetical protein
MYLKQLLAESAELNQLVALSTEASMVIEGSQLNGPLMLTCDECSSYCCGIRATS